MIYWAWLIPAFVAGAIITVVIMSLLNFSAMRESELEHLQRLMAQYPLPPRQKKAKPRFNDDPSPPKKSRTPGS